MRSIYGDFPIPAAAPFFVLPLVIGLIFATPLFPGSLHVQIGF